MIELEDASASPDLDAFVLLSLMPRQCPFEAASARDRIKAVVPRRPEDGIDVAEDCPGHSQGWPLSPSNPQLGESPGQEAGEKTGVDREREGRFLLAAPALAGWISVPALWSNETRVSWRQN